MDTEREAIANAQNLEGMRGGFYENAMGRELQNRTTQGGFYSDAMARELQNAQLGLTGAGQNKDWLLGIGGLLGSGMSNLAGMEQWAGSTNLSAEQQRMKNIMDWYAGEQGGVAGKYDLMNQYGKEMYNYQNQMDEYNKYKNSGNYSNQPSQWNGGMW